MPPPHLVYGTGDEAADVLPFPKYLREGGAECWGSLNGRKAYLAYVVCVLETKDPLALVGGHTLLDTEDLPVETWHRTAKNF